MVAQGDLEEGPALPGLQGRALLPALRHGAVLARGGARLPRRRGPVRVRALPAARRARGVIPRLDHHAVDPALERRPGGEPGCDVRAGAAWRRAPDSGRGAARARAWRGRGGGGAHEGLGAGGHRVRAAVPLRHRLRAALADGAGGRLRDHRGRHGHRAHGARVRRGRLPARRALRHDRAEPGEARRHLRRAHRAVRRPRRDRGQPGHRRGAARKRPALSRGAVRALLPALLALRQPAHLLRQGQLVHQDHGR